MIEGLSHITFITRDLERMEETLTNVLDTRRIYDSNRRSLPGLIWPLLRVRVGNI